jgi:F-type H+-transporting ATPase subunit epsilon
MRTRVLSRKGVRYDGEASAFTVMTEAGEITVLDHHRPLISILKAGTTRLKTEKGDIQTYSVRGGFLEVDPKNVLEVLISEAV